MVAVCGSQAFDNAQPDSDIDMFVVTHRGRLWIVRSTLRLLRLFKQVKNCRLCLPYMLADDALVIEIQRRNFYVAYESAHVIPLYGGNVYRDFLASNFWISAILPRFSSPANASLTEEHKPLLPRLLGSFLGGCLGDWLEIVLFRATLRRVRRKSHDTFGSFEEIREAFRRDRQISVGGGYLNVVRERFCERLTTLFDADEFAKDVQRLFPAGEMPRDSGEYFRRAFNENYSGCVVGHESKSVGPQVSARRDGEAQISDIRESCPFNGYQDEATRNTDK